MARSSNCSSRTRSWKTSCASSRWTWIPAFQDSAADGADGPTPQRRSRTPTPNPRLAARRSRRRKACRRRSPGPGRRRWPPPRRVRPRRPAGGAQARRVTLGSPDSASKPVARSAESRRDPNGPLDLTPPGLRGQTAAASAPVAGGGAPLGARSAAPPAALPPADPVKAEYEAAAEQLKSQHYDAAQQGFAAFVQKNPHSRLIAPAIYHLGESYLLSEPPSRGGRAVPEDRHGLSRRVRSRPTP